MVNGVGIEDKYNIISSFSGTLQLYNAKNSLLDTKTKSINKSMTVKEHYDEHLGYFYSWMLGDFSTKANEFKKFLDDNSISPNTTKIAIDLGAGNGIQSVPLSEQGFKVIAVDFNEQLLSELHSNSKKSDITIINDDIRKVKSFAEHPELVVCCGDTLSHLDSKQEIETFISDIAGSLIDKGKVIFSFRDYSTALTGADRFIPVKNDESKILTCILDYKDDYVFVTDLLYEKTDAGWQQKVSTYKKVRLLTNDIISYLSLNGFSISFNQIVGRLRTIIAIKSQ